MPVESAIERVLPEEVGIPSHSVTSFIDCLKAQKVNIHGFMLMRYGKIAVEGYYYPYEKNQKHRIYSISKSFTSLTIGLLIDEGKLSLNDKIVDIFADKVKHPVHTYTQLMTVEHILKMATVHVQTTQEYSPDWVGEFINTPPAKYPGTIFAYDTTGTNFLCAIVQKITGLTVEQYLREKIFSRIGIGDIHWDTRPGGINNGGSGIWCTLEDMIRFGQLYLNNGRWNREQLISENWISLSTSKKIDTSSFPFLLEGRQGYGYQFWIGKNNSYLCFGMGGQFILVVPDKNIVYATVANTLVCPDEHQLILDGFWNNIYPYIDDDNYDKLINKLTMVEYNPSTQTSLTEAAETESVITQDIHTLNNKLSKLQFNIAEGNYSSDTVELLQSKEIILDPNYYNYAYCKFNFGEGCGTVSFIDNLDNKLSVNFGIGSWLKDEEPFEHKKSANSGIWVSDNTLLIYMYTLDYIQGYLLTCNFEKHYMSINITCPGEFNNYYGFINGTIQN